jgi:hypothetical protein
MVIIAFQTLMLTNAYGQEEEIIDHQLWIDIIPHFEINNRLEYFGDMSYRSSINKDKIRRLMLRPSIRYHWTYELDILAGLGLYGTWDTNSYNTFELRPYQGLIVNWPKIWRMNFKHRGLVEERFLWNNEGDFDPNMRFRYRIKAKLPLNKSSIHYKTVYIPFSYEIFANVGTEEVEKFQNRSRAMLGLGYVFSDKWIGEFEVTFQRSRSNETEELTLSDRIFRFKLTYDGWIFGE